MSRSLSEAVEYALAHGSLFGGPNPFRRSASFYRKRRVTIRVQADIFSELYAPDQSIPYYPDLQDAIRAALAARVPE